MGISTANRRFMTLACFASFIVLGVASGILGPTLAALSGSVALPLAYAGGFRSIRQTGSFLSFMVSGPLLDRRDARWVLVPGTIMMALGLIGVAYSGNLAIAIIASLLIGFGGGFFDVASNYVIGVLYAAGAAALLSALHTFYGLGGSAGPLVAEWAQVQHGDWRLAYALIAAVSLVIGIAFMGMRFRKQPSNTKNATAPAPQPTAKPSSRINWLALLPMAVLIFAYNGAGSAMDTWIFTHARLVALSDVAEASRIASLYWIALTAGRTICVFALRRFGNIPIMRVGVGLSVVGSVLIVLAGSQSVLIAIGVGMVGLGFAPVYPVVIAMGGQQQPEARGMITGILSGLASLGGIIVPIIQGWIGGGQTGGVIVTLIASLVMVVALATMRKPQNI
jgi:fucose permease